MCISLKLGLDIVLMFIFRLGIICGGLTLRFTVSRTWMDAIAVIVGPGTSLMKRECRPIYNYRNFYTTNGNQTIYLNHNVLYDISAPSGIYHCEVVVSDESINKTVYVGLYHYYEG